MINKAPSISTTNKVGQHKHTTRTQQTHNAQHNKITGVQVTANGYASHATIERQRSTTVHAIAAISSHPQDIHTQHATTPGHACGPLDVINTTSSSHPNTTAILVPQWRYRLGDVLRFAPAMIQHAGMSQLLLLQAMMAAYEYEAQHGMPLPVHPDTLFLTNTLWLQHLHPAWHRVGCVGVVLYCIVIGAKHQTVYTTSSSHRLPTHLHLHPCTNSPLHGSNDILTITPTCCTSMPWGVDDGGIPRFIPSCHGRLT